MLEVVWEAFENAGLSLPDHARRSVGVYVGGFMLDHMITQMTVANRSAINQYSAAGMMMTMLSNRVSHTFDFRGPSLSIDTACSSSLVAFNYACQDVWAKTCELAVVGGVNVMMRPEYPIGMCKGHFLARDGQCKSFDERGDGYGRAEGAGVVLLKPLSKALADRDDIWASVIASGTNQDGHTPGISMPSGEAQRALIEQVCDKYNVDPKTISYVECHGTGTAIGDPTEAGAIGSTYGKGRTAEDAVIIGTIKSNLGHMEAGAGVAGIIKAALTLHHREASPLANLEKPNPSIAFENLGIRLSDDRYALNGSKERPIRAAVNSFGYGGSNAHVILEAFHENDPAKLNGHSAEASPISDRVRFMLPITARSTKALPELAGRYLEMLESGIRPGDLIYSLLRRRAHLNQRAVVAAEGVDQLKENLRAFIEGRTIPQVATGQVPYSGSDKPVFVFTGMGPQWWAMGQELYANNSVYRRAVDKADGVFQSISGFSALAEMLKDEQSSQITRTEFAQPANFLIQIGLTAVLKSRGIEPAACVGHSVGELSSAYVAGVLSLDDAMQVCFHRSQQQAKARGAGSMIAVGINLEQAKDVIAEFQGAVSIAAINGETNITLAGDTDCIVDITQKLTAENVFNRMLEVEVPYHGPAMEPLMAPLAEELRSLQPKMPQIDLYSTVTGKKVDGLAYGADYWPANIRQPVEFVQAIRSAIEDGYSIFIEVGPHPVLATSLKECIQNSGKDCRQLFTLRRKTSEVEAMDRSVLEYYVSGGKLNWNKIAEPGRFVGLPNYCWQREFLWVENDRAAQDRMNPVLNPILGTQEAPGTYSYRNDFDYENMHYLFDHKVMGLSILPAAGYVESFLELAGIEHSESQAWALWNFEIAAPLILKEDRAIDFVTTYDPITKKILARSLENGKLGLGQIHAQAELGAINASPLSTSIEKLRSSISTGLDATAFYKQLASIGLKYGPAFQTVKEIYIASSGKESLARLELNHEHVSHLEKYRMHPSLLDGCFQTLMAMIDTQAATYLPTRIDEIRLLVDRLPEQVWCHGRLQEINSRFVECHLDLYDNEGRMVASIKRLRANAAAKRQRVDKWGDPVKLQVLNYAWRVGENLPEPKRLGNWIVVGDEADLGGLVCGQLENFGAIVGAHIRPGNQFAIDGREVSVRPESVDDWKTALADHPEIDGFVFTCSLDASPQSDDPTGQWQLRRIVTALQALFNSPRSDAPRIYLLTQSAFQVVPSDTELNPAQSTFNGFARVAFNELEIGRFTSIDLPMSIDAASFEALIQELICDGVEDEIAIREGQRFVSELALTDALTKDISAIGTLNEQQPILIRPSISENDVGAVRVLEDRLPALEADQVRIMLEKSSVPIDFLRLAPEEIMERPWMEFVGRVTEVGCDVKDTHVGTRVCGFIPAETASHLTVSVKSLHAIEIMPGDNGSKMVGNLSDLTRASAAIEILKPNSGEAALIEVCPLGLELADQLEAHGVRVLLVSFDLDSVDPEVLAMKTVAAADCLRLDQLVSKYTDDQGFSILAVKASNWHAKLGWGHLAIGGNLIDLDEARVDYPIANHIGSVIRTSIALMVHQTTLLRRSILRAVEIIRSGGQREAAVFEVSLHDIAWRKLPFSDNLGKLLLSLDCLGQELPIVKRDELRLTAGGTYLITGGLGGFGQQTARWLIENGVKSVVLTGRTGADTAEKKSFVAKLEATGANVLAVACDASDRRAVRALIERIQSEMAPLKGIIHSAATIIDEPIVEIDLNNLSTVMRNKADAAWILHEETLSIPLEHFILYSSAANLVGNSRQSIYSAANGFLNGLAHQRRLMDLPGLAVNWGAIGDVGIVARDEKLEQFLRYVGLSGMESREALQYLGLAMIRQVPQVGVLIMKSWAEWGRFEVRAGTSARYQNLIAEDTVGGDSAAKSALMEELSKLHPDEQLEVLVALVTDVMAGILKTDAAHLHRSRPINELGVDSLMATEIQLALEQTLGLKIAVLELLSDSNILSLAKNSLASLKLDQGLTVS
ncbi:MAG: SDR family NAD(P)-dependent oxidoreductase [Pirellulales bacterium]